MAERKPCVRCERPIDAYAKSCVYCGWDQALPRPAASTSAPSASAYVPPADHRARNRLLGAIAFVVLVVLAFFIGSIVHGFDPVDTKSAQAAQTGAHPASTAPIESGPRSTVTLVPVEGNGSMQSEPPVTSAPAQPPSAGNVDVNGERADATALPSGAYSAAAQRAKAERDVRTNNGMVDPRSIGGAVEPRPAQQQAAAARSGDSAHPQPSQHAGRSGDHPRPIRAAAGPHTEPIPIYQPVPPMRVDRPTSARFFLTVDAEGRVRDINIEQSIPGEMPRLIAAVQNWRFKPATQNGQPVTSTFSVDINVHPR